MLIFCKKKKKTYSASWQLRAVTLTLYGTMDAFKILIKKESRKELGRTRQGALTPSFTPSNGIAISSLPPADPIARSRNAAHRHLSIFLPKLLLSLARDPTASSPPLPGRAKSPVRNSGSSCPSLDLHRPRGSGIFPFSSTKATWAGNAQGRADGPASRNPAGRVGGREKS